MSASNLTTNAQPGTSIRRVQWPAVFGTESALPLLTAPSPSRPCRIAVVGNHLPRQCGIATFTTDLCDAIAAEYGASALQVCSRQRPAIHVPLPREGAERDC
jgi:hypothetical protein